MVYTLGWLGLFLIYFFTNENEDLNVNSGFLFWFLIWLILIFIGTLELLSHIYYRPWKINKILNSSPLVEFTRKGFVKDEESNLIGSIRGYNLFIGVLWEKHEKQPSYFSQIIFNPFSNERFLRQDEYDKFEESLLEENKTFTLNSLVILNKTNKGFKKTNYESILKDILEAIDFLKARKLEPISFKDWEDIIPKLEKHQERFYN